MGCLFSFSGSSAIMRAMNEQQISRLEARLENLVEGIFAHLFGKRIRAHDIALQLVRAMENTLKPARDGDTRQIAPDQYTICVHPEIQKSILENYPLLPNVLSEQIIDMAASANYRLMTNPQVQIVAKDNLNRGQMVIEAAHARAKHHTTQAMQPIKADALQKAPTNPQLIIGGRSTVSLEGKMMVSIGRNHENDIILDDQYTSRFHAQIRLRFGNYIIFDADSAGGTFVNDVRVKEHRLQTGDVIRIGTTSIVYMQDDNNLSGDTGILST